MPTLFALLALLLLPFLAEAAKARKSKNDCGSQLDRIDRLIERIDEKKQSCKKDSDCELVFQGANHFCDLGTAVSRKVIGVRFFKKLEAAQEKASEACERSGTEMYCETLPYKKAVCEKGICEEEY